MVYNKSSSSYAHNGFDKVQGTLVSDPSLTDWHIVEVDVWGPVIFKLIKPFTAKLPDVTQLLWVQRKSKNIKNAGFHLPQFLNPPKLIGNMAPFPIRTHSIKDSAPKDTTDFDIIDEAILFQRNIFFRNYEIKSEADRTLIYITLYISECLKAAKGNSTMLITVKETKKCTLWAFQTFLSLGNLGFQLNAMYTKPANKNEEDTMKQYLLQLR
ncbi:Actin- protein 2/3 complex subunit 3-A [Bulinus truncatus]|nr:Actin- protein 2/3 complex subunit 3-A [Bulinus truncatus]